MPGYLKLVIIFILLLCIIPIGIILIFIPYNDANFGSLTCADWLAFFGTSMSYLGTVVISLIAVHQSQKANLLSEKVYMLSQREYFVNFSIEKIQKNKIMRCKHVSDLSIPFCSVDATPSECTGYILTIRNYSNYPITHIHFATSYPIGRKHSTETLEREKDIMIAPHDSQELEICNNPNFNSDGAGIKLLISCSNVFNNSLKLEIKLNRSDSDDENVTFSCKFIENKIMDCKG